MVICMLYGAKWYHNLGTYAHKITWNLFFQIWAKLHRWAKLPSLRYVKPDLSRAEFQQLKNAHPGIF